MTLGEKIAQRAEYYIGTPYHHCGRNEHGLDCAGLLIRIAHDLKLTEWDEVDYSQQVNTQYLRGSVDRFCDLVSGPIEVGDIMLIARWGHATHLAVFIGNNCMVHACNKVNRVVKHSYDKVWRRCTVGIYRWRINENG